MSMFASLHPAVSFLYYALTLGFTMFTFHPVYLLLSLLGAAAYSLTLDGRKTFKSLLFLLPVGSLAALTSAAFNHEGATLLLYLPTGNPLTLESILYGIAAAAMLIAVITWFSSFTRVMTSDKFVWLFGRLIPALSLVLSMTLRFVPRFIKRFGTVSEAQTAMGRSSDSSPLLKRIKSAVTVFSAVLTWALENAIETADSMRSRGYGLPGRTAYTNYRFDARDRAMLLWLLFCGLYLLFGRIAGGQYFRFYPTVRWAPVTPMTVSFALVFGALSLTPVIFEAVEVRKWKRSVSGI